MVTQDEEFIRKLQATFKVEAEEHFQNISSGLLELEKAPAGVSAATVIETIFREAHSLKGAARAVDRRDIEATCQAMESVFALWKRQPSARSAGAFDTLHRALDGIRALLDKPGQSNTEPQIEQAVAALNELVSTTPAESTPITVAPLAPRPVSSAAEPDAGAAAGQTVRIPIAKLDATLVQAEDMLALKAMANQRASDLRQLTMQFEHWHKTWGRISAEARAVRQASERAGKNGTGGPGIAVSPDLSGFREWNSEYIRSLENKLGTLTAQADQDRQGVAKRVDEVLQDCKKLLMLPFSTLSAMFPKPVRDLCREQDKQAEVVVKGAEVEIDKRILEEIKDALIHVLRNCVDHGIESPQQRRQHGKVERATITVAVSQLDGNKVELVVCDDGAGVDVARVKAAAVRHGLLSQAEAAALSDADALSLVFHSEISTSPVVTAISGRGLGMAIVRAKVEKLGGAVSIQSKPNAGVTLRMVLPLTLATFRGVFVSCAGRVFVLPMTNVERVVRVKPADIRTVENRQTISLLGRAVSLARLDAVLELPAKITGRDDAAPVSIVVLHFGEQRVAFAVDEVLHEEEVLVKPFQKPLARLRNISGATVLGSGKTVPILNAADLIKSARKQGAAPSLAVAATMPTAQARKKILVVEDSITSRMLLKGILESAGFQVKTAVDGVDAFTSLREDSFDLVVSDVEMPRMNGFDLTARIRSDKRLAELPVILVTALESAQEREHGIDAGANAYIIKSSFDQSNLLEAVRRLL